MPCRKELICGHFCQKACKEDCNCTCEAFQDLQAGADGGPVLQTADHSLEWNQIASQRLTAENVSRVPAVDRREITDRVVVAAEDDDVAVPDQRSEDVNPVPEERVRKMADGRVQYVQQWSPQTRSIEDIGRMSLHVRNGDNRQSVSEGKKREQPARQPQGPRGMGFDGTSDALEVKSNISQRVQEPSVLTWDTEPGQEDETWMKWQDPEELKWEQEQRALRDDSFW